MQSEACLGSTAPGAGDGFPCRGRGLGHPIAEHAMQMAISRARDVGVGIVTTTYDYHIGSAGKYVRAALREGMIGMGMSGRSASPTYSRQGTISDSIQGSPCFCVGMPSGSGKPPFMLDMASRMPQVYLKLIGIAHVANILSGTLGGQMLPRFDRRNIEYAAADQSGFFMALDIERFTDHTAFLDDMDHLLTEVGGLRSLPGFERAELPGGPEWRHEADARLNGIPVQQEAIEMLQRLARELAVTLPWQDDDIAR